MDKVSAAYELAQGFTTLQSVLHIVSVAVIAVLLVVSLLIISNTVKLAMYDRRDEIAIMKWWARPTALSGCLRGRGLLPRHDRRNSRFRSGMAGL